MTSEIVPKFHRSRDLRKIIESGLDHTEVAGHNAFYRISIFAAFRRYSRFPSEQTF